MARWQSSAGWPAQGERMDVCIVGEPTCPERLGDMVKIGRRGALSAKTTACGVQGHSAYPHREKNPLTAIQGGTRGCFFNAVDLVNRLETETQAGKQGRMAAYLTHLDFIILDELGYLPFAQSGGRLRRRENRFASPLIPRINGLCSHPDCFLILLRPPHQPPL